MITIESLVEQGRHVNWKSHPPTLKCCGIHRAAYHQRRGRKNEAAMQREAEEGWLNTRQVRELLNVCGTLNLWAKRGYLVPVKVGNKSIVCQVRCARVYKQEPSPKV
ncbi:MAG: DNA-binding protein [Alistipes indistinctus]